MKERLSFARLREVVEASATLRSPDVNQAELPPPNVLFAEDLPYNVNCATSSFQTCKSVAILLSTQLDLIAVFRNQGLPPGRSTFNPPTYEVL